ncbi:DNA-formamidopyrimidine glycosylase family protein [Agromyces mariniharenae]|uniref:Fpg/Nei family DNA glycosylase n=1 Tax=Agromyces mariniharenae TaxID=2604423 RepID=A0A5S4UUW3_9MICO|nr:DNA-formamidopyrimidine glycosylase family protein [Agromyces mariniharenae]TYL50336.1 Fpg/Nei family DNA glycosylase [Agromyces mariniharenae]
MPESPEVQALADDLGRRLAGHEIRGVDVLEFRVTKTRARPLESLVGRRVAGVTRRGKLLDVTLDDDAHFVVSLGRHGWARYGGAEASVTEASVTEAPNAESEPPPPALVSIEFDDGTTLELTDAGDWISLGGWVVDDPFEVPAVAKLGPDPADPDFTRADFDAGVVGRRKQVKAVLQEQESLAGIGNAYSDEILHAAQLSPVAHAASLGGDELDRLFASTVGVISEAVAARSGVPIDQLKAAKVAAMQVHGRTGEPCPRCGDEIRDFSFASTTAQYSATCQTGGEVLPLRKS